MSTSTIVDLATKRQPYQITWLKASNRDRYAGYYSKELRGNLSGGYDTRRRQLPKQNDVFIRTYASFADMYRAYEKALENSSICQVLGAPRKEYQSHKTIYRRKTHLSFTPNEDNDPIKYKYIVFDIDDKGEGSTLLPEYRAHYKEWILNHDLIIAQCRHYLSLIFPNATKEEIIALSLIARLTSSFGRDLGHPTFRGHLMVPLSFPLPIDMLTNFIKHISNALPCIDPAIYRPTQPIYTSKPICKQPERDDPLLRDPSKPLHRIYAEYGINAFQPSPSDKGEQSLDSQHIQTHLLQYSQSLESSPNRHQANTEWTSASQQPGKEGAYNRKAQRHPTTLGFIPVLYSLGYTYSSSENGVVRWLSPTSSSGQAGTVIWPDGYLHEYHSETPITNLFAQFKQSSPSQLTAYSLHFIYARSQGETAKSRFLISVDKIASEDSQYQTIEYESILKLFGNFERPNSTEDEKEIDNAIDQMLEEAFQQRITKSQRTRIFNEIVIMGKKIDFKVLKGDLKERYIGICKRHNADTNELHPALSDLLNTVNFLKTMTVYKEPGLSVYYAENNRTQQLDSIPNEKALRARILGLIPYYSTEDDWSTSKLNAVSFQIINYINSYDTYAAPSIPRHLYRFPYRDLDQDKYGNPSSRALNTHDFSVSDVTVSDFVIFELPFDEKQLQGHMHYHYSNPDKTIEPDWETLIPHFHHFLHSSLDPDSIELIRDLFVYTCFERKSDGSVYVLHGVPRAGKSILKRLLKRIVGNLYTLEKQPQDLTDQFWKAKFNINTRLLVFNEFNKQSLPSGSKGFNTFQNEIKTITGGDGITIRGMRENPESFESEVTPIIIANEIIEISDQALLDRVIFIPFNKSHAHTAKGDNDFFDNLVAELPGIFYWAWSNPRYDPTTSTLIPFKDVRQDNLKLDALFEHHPVKYFRQVFYEQGGPNDFILKKDEAYWLEQWAILQLPEGTASIPEYKSYYNLERLQFMERDFTHFDSPIKKKIRKKRLIEAPNGRYISLPYAMNLVEREYAMTNVRWKFDPRSHPDFITQDIMETD